MTMAVSGARWQWLVPPPGPIRGLATISLVKRTGTGIFLTLTALYFVRFQGFSVVSVGVGLSIAGAAGLLAGVPSGHLADRYGARPVVVVLLVLTGVANALVLLSSEWWQFVAAASAAMFFETGFLAARDGMVGGLAVGPERATARAYIRSSSNTGLTVGTTIAALALLVDSRAAYQAFMAIDVLAYFGCAVMAGRLPQPARIDRAEPAHALAAARDLPYVAVTLVSGVLGLHYWIVEIALPLWLVGHTSAPRWMVSVLLIFNTVVVVVGQVSVARRVQTIRAARHAAAFSGVLLVAACGFFGASGSRGPVMATVMLVGAASLHVTAELYESAASYLVGFELAPDHAVGQYQGLFGMALPFGEMAAPVIMTALPLGLGVTGWWLLGGILLAASLAFSPVVRWAERSRPRYAAAAGAWAAELPPAEAHRPEPPIAIAG